MKWEIKTGLLYTRKHEWARREENLVTVGITDYAQGMFKDIVFVDLPGTGLEVKAAEAFAVVESVKAVADIYSPVDGVVVEINEALLDQPELINQDPYGEGWMVKIEVEPHYENPELMSEQAYREFVIKEEERS